ncbi:MAG: diguanylate cyclase [Planctomycetota bacterium]
MSQAPRGAKDEGSSHDLAGGFYEGPRLALFYCQEPALPPSCRRVGEFLLARWPEITLRTASTEEDLRASLRQSIPDLLFIDSHGDSELDLLQLERITPDLKRRTLVLLARPSGSLIQTDVSLPSLEQGECLGGRAADFLEDRIRARARHRYEKYRRERLRRTNERLRQLSLEDPLTRIFNRRGFFRFLKSEWSTRLATKPNIACVVIDIDHFKRLNDTYGHAVGDWMLRGFSGILKSSCRTSDILGRVGGEEFCVILPSCTEHQAILWAENQAEDCEHLALRRR